MSKFVFTFWVPHSPPFVLLCSSLILIGIKLIKRLDISIETELDFYLAIDAQMKPKFNQIKSLLQLIN